jgi:hypothetical protein
MTPAPNAPIRFAFGVHLHQPVGNFDYVFADHVRDVYLPFIERAVEREFLPITLHISGPLIEWLEAHDTRYLDAIGRLAAESKVELLLAGFYEPVLASLPRDDRLEQISWMRETLKRRFGVEATGLWLTERVWEPDLAADLHDAGVRYALVDDRHFLVSGFTRDQLHAPFWTESGGKRIAMFPIDERLRYLVPFQSPADTVSYLRRLRADGHRLAVLADDGEKFGGWPGTKEWVYDRGWLARFFDAIEDTVSLGEVQLSTFADALTNVPSNGLAYLSTASYREMEAWSLPPEAALRLQSLEHDLGKARNEGPDGALVRGAHWRNFLVKYAESNRMHKKMLAISALCRERGEPPEARRAIGRAQCNDVYWHGVFGGLYLPHLRHAIWAQLAIAEEILRAGDPLVCETVDLDYDGHDELWIHSAHFSAIVSPHRGGCIEELTHFAPRVNLADALTRRREVYHRVTSPQPATLETPAHGSASIHDLEHGLRMGELPPADLDTRALFVDRMLPPRLHRDAYDRADYVPVASWAAASLAYEVQARADAIAIVFRGDHGFEKTLTFSERGHVTASYRWDASAFPAEALFASEISLVRHAPVHATPETELWVLPIETVAKSEKGLDRTVQGESVTVCWKARVGQGVIELGDV